jgi:hypothetical protein
LELRRESLRYVDGFDLGWLSSLRGDTQRMA